MKRKHTKGQEMDWQEGNRPTALQQTDGQVLNRPTREQETIFQNCKRHPDPETGQCMAIDNT
jgi:hypothetical protein